MTTIQVVLHTAAYLDESDPDYEVGKRAAYRLTIELSDAHQALADATEGQALSIAGVPATSWARVPGIGGAVQTLAAPPTITAEIGPVSPDHAIDGLRRIHWDSTPPGAAHPTRWVGWAIVGTVWTGVGIVDEDDIPDDYDLPGTGLAIMYFNNHACSGVPIVQSVGLPHWSVPDSGNLIPGGGPFSASCRGSIKMPVSGAVRWRVSSDDGCRLWVAGVPVIDDWVNHAADRYSGIFNYEAGDILNVRLEQFNGQANCGLYFAWAIGDAPEEQVPLSVLYPIGWDASLPEAPKPVQASFTSETVQRYFAP